MRVYRILSILCLTLFIGQPLYGNDDVSKEKNDEINDPFEGYNRAMFQFNWALDKVIFRPISEFYSLVPSPARKGVRNFLTNLKAPVTLVNDLLQLEGMRAGQTIVRTLINTTIGLGGIFDMATNMGLEYHSEDFGQTLAVAGVPSGPYIIWPIIGPLTPRDVVGRGVDIAINPFTWVVYNNDWDWVYYGVFGADMLDRRTEARGFTDGLEGAIDSYAVVRSLYGQIRNGNHEDDEDSPKPDSE